MIYFPYHIFNLFCLKNRYFRKKIKTFQIQPFTAYVKLRSRPTNSLFTETFFLPARTVSEAHISGFAKVFLRKYVYFLFQRLASAKAHTSRFVSANLPCNKFKNRLVNIMPYETTRVSLQPIRGVEGSDYINASFIDGYR